LRDQMYWEPKFFLRLFLSPSVALLIELSYSVITDLSENKLWFIALLVILELVKCSDWNKILWFLKLI
jgi:predicted cobalt transporter CbtA